MPVNDIHGGEISTETASLIKQMEAEAQRPEVIPNPDLSGDEPALTGLQVGDDKYAVPQGTEVVANPTLAGTESDLTGLQVGETKYKIPSGGGTTVVANPILEGTEDSLTSLQVGDIKYKNPPVNKVKSLIDMHPELGEPQSVTDEIVLTATISNELAQSLASTYGDGWYWLYVQPSDDLVKTIFYRQHVWQFEMGDDHVCQLGQVTDGVPDFSDAVAVANYPYCMCPLGNVSLLVVSQDSQPSIDNWDWNSFNLIEVPVTASWRSPN